MEKLLHQGPFTQLRAKEFFWLWQSMHAGKDRWGAWLFSKTFLGTAMPTTFLSKVLVSVWSMNDNLSEHVSNIFPFSSYIFGSISLEVVGKWPWD
jgi:hypothetical protein